MIRIQRLLANGESALQEWLGLGIADLPMVQLTEFVERIRNREMIRA